MGRRGRAEVFRGKVDDVRASGARGQGRSLKVGAKGLDTQGKAKEPQETYIDKADVKQALDPTPARRPASHDIKVDQELSSSTAGLLDS